MPWKRHPKTAEVRRRTLYQIRNRKKVGVRVAYVTLDFGGRKYKLRVAEKSARWLEGKKT